MKGLRIGGTFFEMVERPEIRDAQNNDQWGYVDFTHNQIVISSDACKARKHQTILHEVVHALGQEYDLEFNESQVERFSNGLYAFMMNNQKFVREVMG